MDGFNLTEQWKNRLDRINQLYGRGAADQKGLGYNARKYMILKNGKIVAVNMSYPDGMLLLRHCRTMAKRRATDDEFDMAVMEF